MEGPSSLMAHQPSGDVGYISCSQEFLADLRGYHVIVHSDNTSVVSYINHKGGLRSRPLCKLACQILVPREVVVSSSSLHSGGPEYRSRHPVKTGAEARGMEAPPRGGGADMETRVDLFASREVLAHASSSSKEWTGHDGADMAEALSVCIFPDHSAPGSPGESSPGPGSTTSHCPTVAGQSMVPRYISFLEGPSVPSRGFDISPPTRTVETVGLASEGAQLIDSGLSTEVVETILHSRAPSTRKLYALKWRASPVHFKSLCGGHKCLPHSFWWNVIGERPPGISCSSMVL